METGGDTGVCAVLVTAPDAEVGERLGREMVEQRLAACANVVPGMVSVFWWEGAVQRSEEALLILKTTTARLRELEARLVELHPYEVPEVLAMGAQGGHEPYLAWLREEVRGKGS